MNLLNNYWWSVMDVNNISTKNRSNLGGVSSSDMVVTDRLHESTVWAKKNSATGSFFHNLKCIFLWPLVVLLHQVQKKHNLMLMPTMKSYVDVGFFLTVALFTPDTNTWYLSDPTTSGKAKSGLWCDHLRLRCLLHLESWTITTNCV